VGAQRGDTPEARHRVLVVDDDELARATTCRLLERSGLQCEVRTAENGAQAYTMAPDFRPHLIILDLQMPGLDGADLCLLLKRSGRLAHGKILIITGDPSNPRLAKAIEAGASGWLSKPIQRQPFLRKVEQLLGIARDAEESKRVRTKNGRDLASHE